MEENDKIEMKNFPQNNSIITQDNKPYSITSTSNEVQEIFKKRRKKNEESANKKISKNYSNNANDELKNIVISNEKNKKPSVEFIDQKEIIIISLNLISFILFYLCFNPIADYYLSAISILIYPMDLVSFLLCSISSIITSGIIALIILKKVDTYHLLYMSFYYLLVFFLHHFKYIGSSNFDQSLSVFYVFFSLLFNCLCDCFIFYFILKHLYYERCIKKDNILIKSFESRWYSYEKIKRSESESSYLLKEKNDDYVASNKKINKVKFCLIISCLISIQILYIIFIEYKKEISFNCSNWSLGINGTRINNKYNEEDKCTFPKPLGLCYMDFFKGYFDLTHPNNKNCSLREPTQEKKYFLKNIENNNNNVDLFNTNIFAFPHTNLHKKYSLKNQISVNDFGRLVNADIYNLETNKNKEPKPEAILDFSENNIYNGKYAELKINLVFNESLSKERKKLENNNSLFDNIFMLYIDATSRAHFQRALPKLANFIKNFMIYEPDFSKKKLDAYQFMKYHSFSSHTPDNILPMFYGNSKNSNKGTNHIRYFKQNGFITGHEVDMCNKEQYDIFSDPNDKREYEEWDHENIAYLCDGNYFEIETPYPGDRGAFSIKERCLYGHKVSYYMINYAKQFWEKYANNKKYFRMAFNYGHEKTGAVISYLDEPLYDFFFEFYEKGYFNNTAIIIVSDHGNQNNGIYNYISRSQFELEQKMGTFILLLSRNQYSDIYKDNLTNNQHILVTPYDVHDTMIHIMYGNNNNINDNNIIYSANNKGKSVLLKINANERVCEKYDDWMDDHFCCCLIK